MMFGPLTTLAFDISVLMYVAFKTVRFHQHMCTCNHTCLGASIVSTDASLYTLHTPIKSTPNFSRIRMAFV